MRVSDGIEEYCQLLGRQRHQLTALDLGQSLPEGVARVARDHLLLDGAAQCAFQDTMKVPVGPGREATGLAVTSSLGRPLAVSRADLRGCELDDRKRAQHGHQVIMDDFAIALMRLRREFL